jgi:hypothetical protein
MARQIIVLERVNPQAQSSEPLIYRYALWLSVPSARQPFFANASATSAVASGPNKASAGELTAIQNGSIKEVVDTINVPPGTTLAQVETQLQAIFTAAQTALNASTANNWDHYGSSFDGTTWTINTVA